MTKKNDFPAPHEVIMFPQQDPVSIKCFKQTIPVNIYHFYINSEIEDYRAYLDLINTLKTAEEHDRVIIYLNCPGGDLNITIQIINAIKSSRATVVTSIDGQVCSAATLIFLAGHEYIINDHCSFMIHNYSEGVIGKGNEIWARVLHAKDWFQELTYDLYAGFLEDSEIKDVLEGKDIWLDSDEVLERLNRRNKILEERQAKIEKEEEKLISLDSKSKKKNDCAP